MRKELQKAKEALLEQVDYCLSAKNEEYNPEDTSGPFENFSRISNSLPGSNVYTVMAILMAKHVDWLMTHANSLDSVDQDLLLEKIGDIIAYLIIMYAYTGMPKDEYCR